MFSFVFVTVEVARSGTFLVIDSHVRHRPLKHLGAELTVCGHLHPDGLDQLHLEIKPAVDDIETYAVLNHSISCADVAVRPPQVRHRTCPIPWLLCGLFRQSITEFSHGTMRVLDEKQLQQRAPVQNLQ